MHSNPPVMAGFFYRSGVSNLRAIRTASQRFKRKTSSAPTAGSEVGTGDALTSPTGDRDIKKGGRARPVQSCFIHDVVLEKAGPKQQPSARAVTNAWGIDQSSMSGVQVICCFITKLQGSEISSPLIIR